MKKSSKLTFIVNPVAGGGVSLKLQNAIDEYCRKNNLEAEYFYTGNSENTRLILEEREKQGVPFVFVVGGDGTINEVAQHMIGMKMALAILPGGTGNGLARHLGVYGKRSRLLEIINTHRVIEMDYGLVNGKPFFSTAGVGFDAEVGNEFNSTGKKGLKGYIGSVARELFRYSPKKVIIDTGDITEEHTVYLMTFANGSQYGYSAKIAPGASVTDGLIDVVLIKPNPVINIPFQIIRLFRGSLYRSRYVRVLKCKSISAKLQEPGKIQYDGESWTHSGRINVSIGELKLRVLVM